MFSNLKYSGVCVFSVHLKVHLPEIRQKHTHVQRVNKHHYHPKKVYYEYSPHSIELDHYFKTPFRKRKHIATDYEFMADNDHFIGQNYYNPPEDNMLETLKFLQDFYDKHKKKTAVYHSAEPPEEEYTMDLSPLESSKYSFEESDWKSPSPSRNYRPVYMDNIYMPYSGFNWKAAAASLMERKRRHSNVNEPLSLRYKYY